MKLFEPGKIGRMALKNRIVLAPMGPVGLSEFDGRISPRGVEYYATRARGGTGLIITGLFMTQRDFDYSIGLIIDSRNYMARITELAEAVHDYQAKLCIQLTAGRGRVLALSDLRQRGAVAPSAVPCVFDTSITARELSTVEVERLVKSFGVAAGVVSEAGVDSIQLHAHEGYLFDQFQTALWNRRTDKYGGDLSGRLRFAMEVIEAIRKAAGPDYPIIYRFGLTHYLEGGREIEEGLEIARRMEAAGIAALEVDAGCHETWNWPHPTTYEEPGCMVNLAEMVKKVVKIPVIAVGKLGYPDLAEKVLQEGKADYISLGRQLLADPEWPNKVRAGRLDDIRPCLYDDEGCSGRLKAGKTVSCTVNPCTGLEKELALTPAERKKSVLVIGGGPAGMEAARVSALRGHKVTLWEKSENLGGNLIPASVPDFKKDYRRLIDYLSTQVNKVGVTVKLGKTGTVSAISSVKPDVVFVATGGTLPVCDIPGSGKSNVATAVDVLLGKKKTGKSVVVIGGGMVGCELALHLARQGKTVTVVEIIESLSPNMFGRQRDYLLGQLAKSKVKTMTSTMVWEITDKGVTISSKQGNRSLLTADSVVLATGFKPDGELAAALIDKVPEVYAIGDCVEPRKVLNAIWEGYRVARSV